MAKKSMIEREQKRKSLVKKYYAKRIELKKAFTTALSLEEKIQIQAQIQQIPRNSSKTRLRNRCIITGRPRGFFRDFGLSRHTLREMAHSCLLPGVTKSSW